MNPEKQPKTNILIFVLLFVIFIILLVFYNYFQSQKAKREERSSIIQVSNLSFPETITAGSRGSFVWRIDAPSDLQTTATSIYWGYESSPSALTEADSPEAVGYPYHPSDYEVGDFRLPSDFDVSISFNEPGKIYFRSYAKVQKKHLWSEENTVTVQPKK